MLAVAKTFVGEIGGEVGGTDTVVILFRVGEGIDELEMDLRYVYM
jgi:hypothetical protein